MRVSLRSTVVCCVCVFGALLVPGVAVAALPTVGVSVVTAPLTNTTAHTGVTVTASCAAGSTMVGGGAYDRVVANPATLPTNGLVLGGTSPSTGSSPVDTPVANDAVDPSNWFGIANFTGVADPAGSDQAATFALCATGGTANTEVVTASTTGENATQQVNAPVLTIATCPGNSTLIGGGAVTNGAGQVNDGTTVGNDGNLKPMGSYPSDVNGLPAANGSTSATSWTAYGSSGIPATSDVVMAYAVCSTDTGAPPVQVARTDIDGPSAQIGTTVTAAGATCPTGTQLIGGGYSVDQTVSATSGLQPQQGWHMRGSFPSTSAVTGYAPTTYPTEVANGASDPETWEALMQAGGQSLPTGDTMNLHTYAMCVTAPATPVALSTTASPSVAVGSQISDSATLSGGTTPSGTITFNLYGPGDTACGTSLATSTATVTGDGTYQATAVTATKTGTYQWVASYSGDINGNAPITGSCGTTGESVAVTAAAPTLSTTASPALTSTGTGLSDSATLSGGDAPTGTIVFSIYPPSQSSCTTAMKTFTITVSGDGTYASGNFGGSSTAGTYRWIARYSGDTNNAPVSGTCGASGETNTVVQATTLSTTATTPVAIGGVISDAATLGGGSSPTGTMTFKVYGPGDTSCATALATSTATVSGDGTYQSAPFTSATLGTYRWVASYSGDAAGNAAINGTCGASGESSAVTNPPSGANVYATNASGAGAGTDQYTIATDGTLAAKSPAKAAGPPNNAITVSPNDQNVYAVGSNLVTEYAIGAGGTLSPNSQGSIATGTSTSNSATDAAVSLDGKSLYVLNSGQSSLISEYTIAANGTLTPKSVATLATGATPLAIVLSPNGKYAYVTNESAGTISQFTIAADGTLSANPDAATVPLSAAAGITESANGSYVYATSTNGNSPGSVVQFTVNSDGTLSNPASVAAGSGPIGIVLSPNGTSAYVTDELGTSGNTISQYSVAANGNLSPMTPATVSAGAGSQPSAIAMSSDGQYVYTADFGSTSVSQFTVGTGGVLTPDATPTIAAGSQPEGIVVTPDPELSTTASSSVAIGQQIADSATLADGTNPTGTITFNLYGPGDSSCANSLATSTATATGAGTYQSAPFTTPTPGTYQWVASYGGDSGNEAVPGTCGASGESVSVTVPSFTYPTNGATGVDATQPFTWSADPAAQGYFLTVGTSQGNYDVVNSGPLSSSVTSYQVGALPAGETLYARIYTEIGGSYSNYEDVSFTAAAPAIANFTYPTSGQTGVDATLPFTWSTSPGAQGYFLTVGTSQGGDDVVNSGVLSSSQTSYPVGALPAGETLYARIYTEIGGSWSYYQDISFTAAEPPIASFTYPTSGASGVDATQPFTWSTSPDAQGYFLTVGTSQGGDDVVNSGVLSSSQTSYQVGALPAGETLYARIYTEIGGSWSYYQDISFTAAAAPIANFTNPTSGEQNVSTAEPFTWSTSPDAQGYFLTIGTTQGNYDVLNSGVLSSSQTSYQVGSLPAGETLYARIYTEIGGSWSYYQDITFTAGASAGTVHANTAQANTSHANTRSAKSIPDWLRAIVRQQQRSTPRWLRSITRQQQRSTPRWLRTITQHQQRSTPRWLRSITQQRPVPRWLKPASKQTRHIH
jgi:6-phosphogluconolactonase (cycloisomerase 2 family)